MLSYSCEYQTFVYIQQERTCMLNTPLFQGFGTLSIKDFAEQIDKYFSRYGYNQNGDIATPNPTARPKFTYIKTLGNCIRPAYGCNNNQINIINQVMMNGITFWRT